MAAQKNFFPNNIKFLRERKKISQEAMAADLSITRSKLNALENGQTKAHTPEDLMKFSGYFRISIDSLLTVCLSKLGELRLRELEAGNDVYMMGSKIRVLAISVNSKNEENIEFVPKKAQAGYHEHCNDPEFIGALPKFSLPNLSAKRTYRMFPIEGKSMLPFPEDALILTEYAVNYKEIKDGTLCIVVMKNVQQFLFKAVYNAGDQNNLLLRSLNPEYTDQHVPIEDVREIWTYHSHWAKTIPETLSDLGSVNQQLKEIKKDIGKLLLSAHNH